MENNKKTIKVEFPQYVTRTPRVSGGALPNGFSVMVPLTVDFSGATGPELANLAVRQVVIDWQGAARSLSTEFLGKLSKEGCKVHFRNSKTFEDPEKRIAEMVDNGMNPELARLFVLDPEGYNELMSRAAALMATKK